MKQYTSPTQTAKLIELEFEKNGIVMLCVPRRSAPKTTLIDKNFSIGELIEMLNDEPRAFTNKDLIDVRDAMFLQVKAEGEI